MGKLFEILAVEQDRKQESERLVSETIKTFKKENLFSGSIKRTEMFDSEAQEISDDILKLETTVDENLEYSLQSLARYYNVVAQKDASNMVAKADVVIDGNVLLENVPSTTLLGMEKKLNSLRNLFNAIPTLSPGIEWEIDKSVEKDGVFKAKNDITTLKTMKETEYREVSPATNQHPAQIAQIQVTKDIGKFVTTRWSGMITPYQKAQRITKLEKLLSAVKKARQRANSVTTVDISIGEEMVNFIME